TVIFKKKLGIFQLILIRCFFNVHIYIGLASTFHIFFYQSSFAALPCTDYRYSRKVFGISRKLFLPIPPNHKLENCKSHLQKSILNLIKLENCKLHFQNSSLTTP